MSGQHALPHKTILTRLIEAGRKVSWRQVLRDLADVAWKCALVAAVAGLLAWVIAQAAWSLDDAGERAGAILVMLWGFREIVGLMIRWAGREARK